MPGGIERVESYVALLRGINVGGKNRLPMADLVALVEGQGGRDVRTYIQSGNVVFRARPSSAGRLSAAIVERLRERGLSVPVVLREAGQLRAVVEDNPLLARGLDPKTLHVAFLADVPAPERAAGLDPQRSPADAFELRGDDLFLCLPNGVAGSKLSNAYLDRTLGTTCTLRNWRTVQTLAAMASEA